ncbi:Uncharacterized protein TCM_003958 [Theobroma cacao]|uniref:Integrase zinc-binding domain-containing protein n=1 Tax=Theobroma cacao TaxID=3641 RepID=A0A061DQI4_THECC|nr:Uncharacterized protein TCM_003958 [Theobroma cacao]
MEEMHSSTHEGYHKTLQRAESVVFYWPGMRRTICEYIRAYDTCQSKAWVLYSTGGIEFYCQLSWVT